jgi:ribosomal protein S18 acetylase RimI-like enzyme
MPIRPATPADVPAILPMVRALCDLHRSWDPARDTPLPDVVDRYARWLPQRAVDPRSVLLVAEGTSHSPRPAAIAGFLVATVEQNIPIYSVTEFGFIHDLWIEPAHRGQGLAKALTFAALDRFRDMGVRQIRLETAHANNGARHLFAACGFRQGPTELLIDIPVL